MFDDDDDIVVVSVAAELLLSSSSSGEITSASMMLVGDRSSLTEMVLGCVAAVIDVNGHRRRRQEAVVHDEVDWNAPTTKVVVVDDGDVCHHRSSGRRSECSNDMVDDARKYRMTILVLPD